MVMHGVSLGYEYSVISGKALAFIVNVFQLQKESLKPGPLLISAKSGKWSACVSKALY